MTTPPFEIKKYGSNALLLEWPKRVDLKILMEILSFQEYLRKNHLPGDFWEFVPIYHSLTLINRSGTVDLESIAKELPAWYEAHPKGLTVKTQKWELPVCYEEPYNLDLDDSARRLGMEPEELIALHTGRDYPVYGIGFLPGFLYLGGIPKALKIPRRESPRMKVPRNPLVAGRLSGIAPSHFSMRKKNHPA